MGGQYVGKGVGLKVHVMLLPIPHHDSFSKTILFPLTTRASYLPFGYNNNNTVF